jgi:hypothetical protein
VRADIAIRDRIAQAACPGSGALAADARCAKGVTIMPRYSIFLVLFVTACTPREHEFTSDPLLTVGHGAFIAADGKQITPDLSFIERAQRYYIEALLEQARERETLAFDKARALINREVKDRILADATYIDWLIGAVEPPNAANLTAINNAFRWQYLDVLSKRDWTADQRAWWGLGKDIADKLRKHGVKVQRSIAVGGPEYIRSCAAAGVPIPPPVFSAGWNNRGAIVNPFLSPSMTAEVMHYSSSSPEGACIALPRYPAGSDRASLFGLICIGKQSRNACFWDNPRGVSFQKNVPVPIDEFVGGVDLVANAQGVCSDCHAGENPYVIHPDNPPFAGITPAIMPVGWHRPLVDASWPQNPGPTSVLDAESSTRRCDSCHRVGSAGRFPDASSLLPGWCGTVFGTAIGGGSTNTMPPAGLGPQSDYANHIQAIKNLCDRKVTPGQVVPSGGLADDPGFVSPPLVFDPIYACGTKVAVRSGIYDAKIMLTVNGNPAGSKIAKNPNFEEFTVAALQVGDSVAATQEFAGATSAPSATVTVRDHKVDYPDGLPAPSLDPELIYECARVVAIRNVPSATITLFTNGAFPSSGIASTDWSAIFGGKTPFAVNDTFTAEQSLCADSSPRSTAVVKAIVQPSSIPAPTFNPPMIYSGQQLTTLETLVHGARVDVRESTAGALGSVETPVSWFPNFDVATPLGRPLNLSDQLIAMQGLCTKGPDSPVPPAVRCEALPPPRIAQPWVGATYVVVLESVPGARVHIYDASAAEIGDGSGTVIPLSRAVVAGDQLTAVQQIGECTSRNGYRVTVPK